jgi:hypothetical protein
MEFSSFPKNLAYNIKTLAGFSKSTVVLSPDKTGTIQSGDTFKVKLPSNTIVDLRTFTMYFKGVASATSGNVHFPRLSSSIIKNLSVFINGTQIESIQSYNTLFNKLYDLDGGGVDQTNKRFLENADPSVNYEYVTNSESVTGGTPVANTLENAPINSKKMMINNWIGFLSTCNCPCIDTNDLNNVEIEFTLDSEKILWSGAAATANTNPVVTGAKYELQDLSFTISKIVFNDPLYYNLKADKLLSSGLVIGYQTYITSKQAGFTKGTSVNVLTTVNSTSLDQLICCLQPTNLPIAPLQLTQSNSDYPKHFNEVYALGGGGQTNGTLANQPFITGDFYNQSHYFRSNATGLTSLQVDINNVPLMPQPL